MMVNRGPAVFEVGEVVLLAEPARIHSRGRRGNARERIALVRLADALERVLVGETDRAEVSLEDLDLLRGFAAAELVRLRAVRGRGALAMQSSGYGGDCLGTSARAAVVAVEFVVAMGEPEEAAVKVDEGTWLIRMARPEALAGHIGRGPAAVTADRDHRVQEGGADRGVVLVAHGSASTVTTPRLSSLRTSRTSVTTHLVPSGGKVRTSPCSIVLPAAAKSTPVRSSNGPLVRSTFQQCFVTLANLLRPEASDTSQVRTTDATDQNAERAVIEPSLDIAVAGPG